MAEESPQNINPATDPQVEDPPSTAVPLADVDRAPAEVNPTVNPQALLPADIASAPDPTVAAYFQNKAELEAFQKITEVGEDGRATFVANPEERAEFVARLESNNQQLEAELQEKGLLSAVQQAEEQDRIANASAQPPIGSLAELYPDDEPTVVSVSEIDRAPAPVEPATNPQVAEPADQDPIPSLATTEVEPLPVTGDTEVNESVAQQEAAEFVPAANVDTEPVTVAEDPEVAEFQAQQEAAEFVPVSDVDTEPAAVTSDPEIDGFETQQEAAEFVPAAAVETDPTTVSADDPQQPAEDQPVFVSDLVEPSTDDPQSPAEADTLPDAFVYEAAETPESDPIVLAQADNIATDVVLVDITQTPDIIGDDDPTVPEEIAPSEGGFYGEPTPVGGNFTSVYDPETGNYNVVDLDTGDTVETGLSQQDAALAAQDLSLGDPQFPNETEDLAAAAESDLIREPTDVDVAEAAFVETDTGFFELQEEAAPQPDEFGFVEADDGFFVQQDEIEAQIDQAQFEGETDPEEFVPLSEVETEPEPVDSPYEDQEAEGEVIEFTQNGPVTRDAGEATAEAARIEAQRQNLRNQQSIREQRGNNVDAADWRVRLRLAPQASYLYKDTTYGPGILQPLEVSDGIIFPYTPSIQTVYKADYTPYNLTHSNYRGFFYQSSYVEDVTITGTFTAQDSVEAAYLLAVIHFFRSATKMFYGQDPQAGAPPPLVFLSAFGQYQYVDAPCVISQFNYSLPADVDYIRARAPNQDGTNLLKRRDRKTLPTNAFSAALQRLKNARPGGLPPGGEVKKPAPPTLGLSSPTYVPTKMDITIMLHPMQSRRQVSQQFSVQEYGPGRLTPKGFW